MTTQPHLPEPPLARTTTFARLALLFLGMFTAILVLGIVSTALEPTTRTTVLTVAALQNVLAFALPSIFMAYLCDRYPFKDMCISSFSNKGAYIFAALTLISSIPFLNQTIYWNEQLQLPDCLSYLKQMEDEARKVTDLALSTESVGGVIVNVLIIGCLTGLCEELFFRAGVQRMLSRSMNPHAAIWLAAAIFSFCHFQVFGFVPRMLLGALLGYLYFYSKSVWVPAAVHAMNNSTVIISTWDKGCNVDKLGVGTGIIPWLALAGLAVTLVLFYKKDLFMPWLKRKH